MQLEEKGTEGIPCGVRETRRHPRFAHSLWLAMESPTPVALHEASPRDEGGFDPCDVMLYAG
jgi:hypothetical protein